MQGHLVAAQTSAPEQSKPETAKSIHQMFLDDQDDTPAGKPEVSQLLHRRRSKRVVNKSDG
jgi:hypothetical protein